VITGIALIVIGLPLGFFGATKFNFGIMVSGWCVAAAGAVIFVSHAVSLP